MQLRFGTSHEIKRDRIRTVDSAEANQTNFHKIYQTQEGLKKIEDAGMKQASYTEAIKHTRAAAASTLPAFNLERGIAQGHDRKARSI